MRGHVVIGASDRRVAGKRRPSIIAQDGRFNFDDTVIVVPLTTEDAVDSLIRPLIMPDTGNGLRHPSCAIINRLNAMKKMAIDQSIGVLSAEDMSRIDAAMCTIFGLNQS